MQKYYRKKLGVGAYIASSPSDSSPIAYCFAKSYDEACDKLKAYRPCNIGERWYASTLIPCSLFDGVRVLVNKAI